MSYISFFMNIISDQPTTRCGWFGFAYYHFKELFQDAFEMSDLFFVFDLWFIRKVLPWATGDKNRR